MVDRGNEEKKPEKQWSKFPTETTSAFSFGLCHLNDVARNHVVSNHELISYRE